LDRPQELLQNVLILTSFPFSQIFEGLKEASFDVSGKNALNVLYTALTRSGDVRKVAPNTWGLREWYPHLKEPKKRIPVISNADDVLPPEPT